MLPSADQIATALTLLVPGFLWTKLFYYYGLGTKTADAQWYMWSILLSAPVASVVSVAKPPQLIALAISIAYGIAGGSLSILLWRLVLPKVLPALYVKWTVGAWDAVFSKDEGNWIQIQTKDGTTLTGWPKYVAQLGDNPDPDLFLKEVQSVVDGKTYPLEGVDGLLLQRSAIQSLWILAPSAETNVMSQTAEAVGSEVEPLR